MRKALLLLLLSAVSALGRLGDTREQAESRYGLEKPLPKYLKPTTLLEGARELIFEFQGWKIRCAFLLATDGKEYVVREEYTKIVGSKGVPLTGFYVTEDEREAILAGEAGGRRWRKKLLGKVETDPLQAAANQLAYLSGLTGPVWIREDGAVARLTGSTSMNVVLELPQAGKYEAELKKINDAKAKASVPSF